MKIFIFLSIFFSELLVSSCSSNSIIQNQATKITVQWKHDNSTHKTQYYLNDVFVGEGTNGVNVIFKEISGLEEGSTVLFLKSSFGTPFDGSSPGFGFYLLDDPQMKIADILSEKKLIILSDSIENNAK